MCWRTTVHKDIMWRYSLLLFLSLSVLRLNGISLLSLETDSVIKMVVSTTVCSHENMYRQKKTKSPFIDLVCSKNMPVKQTPMEAPHKVLKTKTLPHSIRPWNCVSMGFMTSLFIQGMANPARVFIYMSWMPWMSFQGRSISHKQLAV